MYCMFMWLDNAQMPVTCSKKCDTSGNLIICEIICKECLIFTEIIASYTDN